MGYGKRLSPGRRSHPDRHGLPTVGKNRDISLGLVGDPGAILTEVAKAAKGRSKGETREGWLQTLRDEEQRPRKSACRADAEDAPDPPAAPRARDQRVPHENTIFIGDGGDVVTFSGGVVQPRGPGLWMDPGPLGTSASACRSRWPKQARPDREVVCLFGDGAFSLTGWDFETMVRFDLPFIGVMGNNSYMNQIRYGQIQKYGEDRGDVGNKLGDVKYDRVRQDARRLQRGGPEPKDIRPALERAARAASRR